MNLMQAIKMAAKSIFSNKGRSVLTMLGVIIGLAAVMILVSYAQGQNMAMNAYYESMGTNKINVYAYTWGSNMDVGKILYDYCLPMEDVLGVSPMGYVYTDVTIKYETKTLARDRGGMMGGGGMVVMPAGGGGGSSEEYPQIYLGNDKFGLCNNYTIAKGRELSYMDVEKLNQVCVLGAATAEYLFSFADPIDKMITLNGQPFRVVGVYQSKGGRDLGSSEENAWMEDSIKRMDRMILLPSTMTRYFNNNQPIDQYIVKVADTEGRKRVTTDLKGFLPTLLNGENGNFDVYSEDVYIGQNQEQNAMQQKFLGGIAAISLLVGGIGIMNIMLVTVTERTREIGIRKAIGAERKSIITQFLIEAAMICGIGGILGIGVGYLGTLIVGKLSFGTILVPSAALTVGAFAISVVLGIIFGLYPAIKASGLQPVEALRAE